MKILFVCMGNICRSPAGENVMRHLVEKAGLQDKIICDSAGTIGYHVGEKPDGRMSAAAAERGIEFVGRSRKFTPTDFDHFDLIVTMDENNRRDVLDQARKDEDKAKVEAFCHWVQNFSDSEVPDPYYGGTSGFEHVMDLMEDGCSHLLKEIQSKFI